jgi:phenylalanine-4-hydroxylase
MHAGGAHDLVELDRDHPGFRDTVYRARRNEIARVALAYEEPAPVPDIAYTDVENDVWRTVWTQLAPLHDRFACRAYHDAAAMLSLDRTKLPQLSALNRALAPHGFRMLPVAGLVSARTFLTYLARRAFLSTQYVRHASRPFYTPEPDVIHELIGHAVTLVHPVFVELSFLFGEAMVAEPDDDRAQEIARAYWYTLEFGAVRERGELKVYGAGLLSSFGELQRFQTDAELRPLDLDAAARIPFDPTDYQSVVFIADDLDGLPDLVRAWLARRARR